MFLKKFNVKIAIQCVFIGLAAFALFQTTPSHAFVSTVCTWTGATNQNFNTGSNWSGCGGTTPPAGAALTFPTGITNKTLNNDMPADSSFTVFRFNETGYVISGNALVQTDGITGPDASTGASNYTFNAPVKFMAVDMTNTMKLGNVATFNGQVTLDGMSNLRWKGSGKVVFAGGLSGSTGSINPANDASLDATEITISGQTNDYTATNINAIGGKTIVCASSTCFGKTTNLVNIIGDNTITINTEGTISNPISISGTGGSGKLIFKKTTTLNGDITLTNSALFTGDSNTPNTITVASKLINNSETQSDIMTYAVQPNTSIFNFTGTIPATSLPLGINVKDNATTILNTTNLATGLMSISGNVSPGKLIVKSLASLSTAMGSGLSISSVDPVIFDLPANSTIDARVNFTGVINTIVNNDVTLTNYNFGVGSVFNKTGTGTMTFAGTNTTVPSTLTITNGPISFNNDAFATTSVNIGSGVTLKGNGKVGAVAVAANGTVNPGNSPGCLTVASISYVVTSVQVVEIAGNTVCTQYDQLKVTGAANLANATLSVVPSYTPTVGQVFTILTAGTLTGTYSGLAEGATITANTSKFTISYLNNNVTLTYVGSTVVTASQNPITNLLAQTGINSTTSTIVAIVMAILAISFTYYIRVKARK